MSSPDMPKPPEQVAARAPSSDKVNGRSELLRGSYEKRRQERAEENGFKTGHDMDANAFQVIRDGGGDPIVESESIKGRLERGDYKDKPEEKAKAEKVALYDSAKGYDGRDNSNAIKYSLELAERTKTGDSEQGGLLAMVDLIHEDVEVILEKDGQREIYTVNAWERKLEDATPEDRSLLEQEGIYTFAPEDSKTPQTADQAKPDEAIKLPRPENELIAKGAVSIGLKIEDAKASGADKKAIQRLESLKTAAKMAGEINDEGATCGDLYKLAVLKALQVSGVEDLDDKIKLDDTIKQMEEKVPGQLKVLNNFLDGSTVYTKEQIAYMADKISANPNYLFTSELISKVPGLEKMIFGKEFSEGELKSILKDFGVEDKKSKASLLALLAVIMGTVLNPMVEGLEIGPSGR